MATSQTVPQRIQEIVAEQPDHEAYIFRSQCIGRMTLTRRQVKDLTFTFTERLTRVGVRKGDVVCNTLQNGPERVVADLGIMCQGAVMVDKRAFVRDLSDMVHVLTHSQATTLIVDPTETGIKGASSAWQAVRAKCTSVSDVDPATDSVTVTWPDVTTLRHVIFCTRGESGKEFTFLKSLQHDLERRSAQITAVEQATGGLKGSDLAVLFPTSGSTGLPKLSMNTHYDILTLACNWNSLFPASGPNHIVFQDRPLGWMAAFQHPFFSACTPKVMTDGRTETPEGCPRTVWTYICEEKVTFAHLTPQTVFGLLDDDDVTSGRLGGGWTPKELLMTGQPLKKFIAHVVGSICTVMYNSYGMTEAGYITAARCDKEEDFEDYLAGYPHPRAEIKIVDDEFRPLQAGESGWVLIRSGGQFQGYFNNESRTKAALLEDGWVRTDDLGYLDDAGRLFMLGRQSDAIMRGVVIVYPYEIEQRMAMLEGVKDVMVVGVPDRKLYHEVCACVILHPGSSGSAETIKDACTDVAEAWANELPVPKYVLVFDAFPATATGKVSRKELQQEACRRLGLKL